MIIGVPKEIKTNENRVALTPAGALEFSKRKHTVYVQSTAGEGSGFDDDEYEAAGAKILPTIEEVYAIVGAFSYDRNDLHITEALKEEVLAKCNSGSLTKFGELEVRRLETIDGWKYHFDNDQWLMIRASGTEPVLRTYAESNSLENARKILAACKTAIGA